MLNRIWDYLLGLFGKADPERRATILKHELDDYLARATETVVEAEQHAEATAAATTKRIEALTVAMTHTVEKNKTVQAVVADLTALKNRIVNP